MKPLLILLSSTIAVPMIATPAVAQHMPGMTMPMPTPVKKAPAKKKPAARKPRAKKAPANKARAKKTAAKKPAAKQPQKPGAPAMTMPMDHGATAMPQPHGSAAMPMTMPMDNKQPGASPLGAQHSGHSMAMSGALGPYPFEREASGTAWQPDTTEHGGLMTTSGDWTLMTHAVLNLVYDHQSGPRGDDQAFASGMLMGMARRPLGNGTLQLKAMVSPDPIMGKRGYPLLLASGETANGVDHLIDRQHPHDFFMELSASISQNIGKVGSVFLYGGLPGEPAFGPPAFMHREAIPPTSLSEW